MKKGLLTVFLCLTCFANLQAQSLDLRLLQHINGPPSGADDAWRNVSKSDYVAVSAVPLTLLITGLATHNKPLAVKAVETGAAIIVAEVFTTGLKVTTQRTRPYLAYPDVIYGKSNSADYSFPSGHTAGAFALATSLSLSFPKWYVIAPSYTYAAAVGYSRMYLGVHYPSDVLCGALVGVGSSFLTHKVQKLLHKKYHDH